MELDQDMLMMTSIGKPVLFLSKHPLETAENRRLCQALIQRWAAAVFNIAANPQDLTPHERKAMLARPAPRARATSLSGSVTVTGARPDELIGAPRAPPTPGQNLSRLGRYSSIVPPKANLDFRVVPESNWTELKGGKAKAADTPLAHVTEKVRSAKRARSASSRASDVSINRLRPKI